MFYCDDPCFIDKTKFNCCYNCENKENCEQQCVRDIECKYKKENIEKNNEENKIE